MRYHIEIDSAGRQWIVFQSGRRFPWVRFAGGAPGDGDGDGDVDGDGDGDDSGDDDGDDSDDKGGDDDDSGDDDDGDDDSDDDKKASKKVQRLSRENARRRREAKEAKDRADAHEETLKALRKALDPDAKDDDDVDVKDVQRRASALESENKSLKVQVAIAEVAATQGADITSLMDSRSFVRDAEELDPDKKGFRKSLGDMVKAAVETNPKLKAGQRPPRSTLDDDGSAGDNGERKPLKEALAAGLSK